jgi:hypothetical protein
MNKSRQQFKIGWIMMPSDASGIFCSCKVLPLKKAQFCESATIPPPPGFCNNIFIVDFAKYHGFKNIYTAALFWIISKMCSFTSLRTTNLEQYRQRPYFKPGS